MLKTYALLQVLLVIILIQSSCFNRSSIQNKNIQDTVVNKNEIVIKYNIDTDTVNIPVIVETSTIMITDSMLKSKEFSTILRDKVNDTLNYINCYEGQSDLPVKFYSYANNIFECSIYFSTQAGWFWFGKIENDSKGNLIFKQGNHKVLPQYGRNPIFSRIKFNIYIPKQYKIEKPLFRCF